MYRVAEILVPKIAREEKTDGQEGSLSTRSLHSPSRTWESRFRSFGRHGMGHAVFKNIVPVRSGILAEWLIDGR